MAKKSSTIHVEDFVWKCFEKYQEENDITSRNTAIECIIAEYKALKSIGSNPIQNNNNIVKTIDKEDKKEENMMFAKLKQMEDDMLD